MKATETCPKCQCRRLFVIEKVAQAAHDSINGVNPMSVTTLSVPSHDLGLQDDNDYRAEIGHFEAWVCSKCGYTEWYTKGAIPALERYVAQKGRGVRLVDRGAAPYR